MTRAAAAAGEAAAVAADGAADGAAVGGGTDATAVAHRVAAAGGVTPMAAVPAAREAAARVAASGVDATGPEAAAGDGTDRARRATSSSGASDGTSNAIDIGNMTRWRWAGCRVESSGASRKRRGGRSRRRGGERRPRAAITRTHDGASDT